LSIILIKSLAIEPLTSYFAYKDEKSLDCTFDKDEYKYKKHGYNSHTTTT